METTKEISRTRKLSPVRDLEAEESSVSQLQKIPLKRRLEILFASSIIPSRRQLANKYELSEELIHTVLSHRKYLLENWKYNADSKGLLSKLELENAVAMTELLIEWKRRVQLNGLQITEAALTRKSLYLQRVLNDCNEMLTDKWWHQFDVNWIHKKFQDFENDSLEFEDILNDLRWMFADDAYQRLNLRFRRAKYGNRMPSNVDYADIEDFNELDYNLLDEIKIDPDYFNDDDFDCEDYEFVMDEDVVIDALRKELEDSEQAKYQQYLLGSDENKLCNQIQDEMNSMEAELKTEFESIADGNDDHDDNDDSNDLIRSIMESYSTKGTSLEEEDGDGDGEEEKEVEEEREEVEAEEFDRNGYDDRDVDGEEYMLENVFDAESPKILIIEPAEATSAIPKPKRKKRNLHAVVSLRKDYVRMPAVAEIALLARKQCLEQLLQESEDTDDDNDDEFDAEQEKNLPRKYNRKKYGCLKSSKSFKPSKMRKTGKTDSWSNNDTEKNSQSKAKTSDMMENPSGYVDAQLDLDTTIAGKFNYDSYDGVKREIPSPLGADCEEFISQDATNFNDTSIETTHDHNSMSNHNVSIKNEQNNNNNNNNNDDDDFEGNDLMVDTSKITTRRSTKSSADEIILGGPFSGGENDSNEMQKTDEGIEEIEISEIKDEHESDCQQQKESYQEQEQEQSLLKRRISKLSKSPKSGNKKPLRYLKSPMKLCSSSSSNSVLPMTVKRAKRRRDCADLTLRKDQVRLSVVRLASDRDNDASDETADNGNGVQMIFEPYSGED